MSKNDAKKDFDCVEFKRRAQAGIYERIQGLSPTEEIAYFEKAAEQGPLGESWRAMQRRAKAGTATQ